MAEDKLARLLARDGAAASRPHEAPRARPGGPPNPRASLVRQAITLVLQYPSAAADVTVPPDLEGLGRPGLPLLAALLEDARAHPKITTGGLLERWREKTDYPHLAKLAAAESLTGEEVAPRVLQDTLERLAAEAPEQRADELLAHARVRELTAAEKSELRELLGKKATGEN
jgi:DNA primase